MTVALSVKLLCNARLMGFDYEAIKDEASYSWKRHV